MAEDGTPYLLRQGYMAGYWEWRERRSCDSDRERPGTLADFGYMSGELCAYRKAVLLDVPWFRLDISSSVVKPMKDEYMTHSYTTSFSPPIRGSFKIFRITSGCWNIAGIEMELFKGVSDPCWTFTPVVFSSPLILLSDKLNVLLGVGLTVVCLLKSILGNKWRKHGLYRPLAPIGFG